MTKDQRIKADESDYPGAEYQQLFDHMSEEHGLTLLQSEMDEIIRIVKGAEAEAESNSITIERINKYALHQFNRGGLGLDLVSFEEWYSDTTP